MSERQARSPKARKTRCAGDRGQALVELALVIPLLLILAFGVVGVSRVIQAQMAVSAVSREAARAAALANSPGQATADGMARGQDVAAGYRLSSSSMQLVVDSGPLARGSTVVASVRYRVSLADLPLLGWSAVTVTSTDRERVDLYRSFWQTRGTP